MNSQTETLANNLIDQTLRALRDTQVPDGLEQRIAARLAQAAEAPTGAARNGATPLLAVILTLRLPKGKVHRIVFAESPTYAWATVAFVLTLGIVSLSFFFHRHTESSAQSHSTSTETYAATQESTPPHATTPPQTSIATNYARQNVALKLRNASAGSELPPSAPVDLDAIALAETQAPSLAAPRMPLTAQEVFLFRATRTGQPLEIAELEPLRLPALRAAAEAHQRAGLENFVRSLLAPLALSESLNPTPQDDSPPAPSTSTANDLSTNGDTPHVP
jgi:hypothetical protein